MRRVALHTAYAPHAAASAIGGLKAKIAPSVGAQGTAAQKWAGAVATKATALAPWATAELTAARAAAPTSSAHPTDGASMGRRAFATLAGLGISARSVRASWAARAMECVAMADASALQASVGRIARRRSHPNTTALLAAFTSARRGAKHSLPLPPAPHMPFAAHPARPEQLRCRWALTLI